MIFPPGGATWRRLPLLSVFTAPTSAYNSETVHAWWRQIVYIALTTLLGGHAFLFFKNWRNHCKTQLLYFCYSIVLNYLPEYFKFRHDCWRHRELPTLFTGLEMCLKDAYNSRLCYIEWMRKRTIFNRNKWQIEYAHVIVHVDFYTAKQFKLRKVHFRL